jgi:hypothetical protein
MELSMANSNRKNSANEQEVEVLYQKLGENWFAFSMIDDEFFMSPVSDDKISEIKNETRIPEGIFDNEAA